MGGVSRCFLTASGPGVNLALLTSSKISEQLPCRSVEVKNFFSVFLCQRCREIWREIFRATFSRVWVCDGKFHQNFTSKTVWKTEKFTQISLCWGAPLTKYTKTARFGYFFGILCRNLSLTISLSCRTFFCVLPGTDLALKGTIEQEAA